MNIKERTKEIRKEMSCMNKIKKLTKIFLKDYYQNLNIINKKNNNK